MFSPLTVHISAIITTAGDIVVSEVDASAMPAEASVLGGGLTLTETVKGAASLTARFALYPSILYNLARNRLQDNWHWWDKITEVGLSGLPHHYCRLVRIAAC